MVSREKCNSMAQAWQLLKVYAEDATILDKKSDLQAEKAAIQEWGGRVETINKWREADLNFYESEILKLGNSDQRLAKLTEFVVAPSDEIKALHQYISLCFEALFPCQATWDTKEVTLTGVHVRYQRRGVYFTAHYSSAKDDQPFKIPAETVQLNAAVSPVGVKALSDYVKWRSSASLITELLHNETVRNVIGTCYQIAPHPSIGIELPEPEAMEDDGDDDDDVSDDEDGPRNQEDGDDPGDIADPDYMSNELPVQVQVPDHHKRKNPDSQREEPPAKKPKQ